MKVEEIHLALSNNQQAFKLTQLSDSAISSLNNFLSGDLQKTYDEKDLVSKQIENYNKKVDSTISKFRALEKGEYLKAYNDITSKSKDLGISPSDVPGLLELDKKYFKIKEFVSDLIKL